LGWELYEKRGINADRLYEFLKTHIMSEYKDKLIILDNASSHRNDMHILPRVLYTVP
jgi:hypothetical protein